ncbi:MAG: DsrE family protein [Campylobacterota bacterium]|nr:DsrE family protein [Campylobacterota bacterium]
MTDKLLIVWSSSDVEVAKKMVLLYSSVILPRGYWDEAHLMVWGPSAKLLAENSELQEMLKTIAKTGVELSTCVVCTDDYGVTEQLRSLGIDPIHTGELMTNALKNDWKVITF